MHDVYLLLGSNLGDPKKYIDESKKCIEQEIGMILKASAMYQTAAWGETDQADFINQALLVSSALDPQNILDRIHQIEMQLGRRRTEKWSARTIDIDILFYADQCIQEDHLIIPHPFLHQRHFTLVPLSEIAPHFFHPILNKTIAELCEAVTDNLSVKRINPPINV